MRRVILAVILPLVVVLAGCATTPQIPYDRMTAGEIKAIGIVTPKFPNRATVILATTVGQSFGLVGALVDAGLQEGRDSSFDKMVKAQNFVAQDAFMQRLTETLQGHGYTVSNISAMRTRDGFMDKYPMEPTDAYLDLVVTSYGYIAAGIGNSTPYRPRFAVQVRLVRASDSSVLMQDTVLYNPYTPGGETKAITISPDPAYEYATFDALESSSEKAVTGLQDAVYRSADAVGNLLR
jgi:hypothetical protein